jgi:Cu+-exporting ATPase
MVGTGLGAKNGILIKGGEALEIAHGITGIVFDKTGTLTHGKPLVTNTVLFDSSNTSENQREKEVEFYKLIGSAETASEHPLGRAIVQHAKELLAGATGVALSQPDNFQVTSGQGLSCTVDGHSVLVGNRKWMQTNSLTYAPQHEAEMIALEEQVNI